MTKPSLDDLLWSEDQAIDWCTQEVDGKDSAESAQSLELVIQAEPGVVRYTLSSGKKVGVEERRRRIVDRRREYFPDALTAPPLFWVWLVVSLSPRYRTTIAARREFSRWITAQLRLGIVPCLKYRSARRFRYDGEHNGYPVFHLPFVPFLKGHPDSSPDDWEVTFTRLREDVPHRDAVQANAPKARNGGSTGCDEFVRRALEKMARREPGRVTRLGASLDNPRQYRLHMHRATLADELAAKSGVGGVQYARETILKSLSKFAISRGGPIRETVA